MKRRKGARALDERSYSFDVYPKGTLALSKVDLSLKVRVADYDRELLDLQREVLALQLDLFQQHRRAILVFEGWDAAGKGGAIRRLTALMDPRGYKVWPISAPKDAEERHHYLWRFWTRLPEHGELAIFDRSWYGRVLVERVEGFARKRVWRRAYDEINAFEKTLGDDGVKLAKFWIHIDQKTQLERFRARESDPFKSYKISPEDWRNRKSWKAYEAAIGEMLDKTHRPDAKWHLISGNDKKFARLEVLRRCVKLLSEPG
jgi:polyphosphate kinase 2 (PPK2 family)